MKVTSTKDRFGHLKSFKGVLHFTKNSNKTCCIMLDGELVGMGVFMFSTGQKFRVLFNTPEQKTYASVIQARMGRVGLNGYRSGDTIFVRSLSNPPKKLGQITKLHRIREAQKFAEDAGEVFTGKHRSHETFAPGAAKHLSVNLGNLKKDKEVKPVVKKKKQKADLCEFELEKQKEKRVDELQYFKFVHDKFNNAGIRAALADSGFSYDDIELAKSVISVCKSYMSHRAYK